LLVTGGTLPYTYSWAPVSGATSSLTGLAPGHYSVTVTDQNGGGCSESESFDLSNLNGPSLSFNQNNISCFGACNGSVIAVSTGTAATTFTWSTGSNVAGSGTACAGVITLTASANGCKAVHSFSLTENPKLELAYFLKPVSCINTCDGIVDLQPIGGKLSYSFAGTTASNISQTPTLCAGNYTLSVTDAAGCRLDSVIALKNPAPISPTVNSLNSSCSSVPDGSASVAVSGGKPNYKYLWHGPASYTANTGNITNIFSGTYSLSVTDSLGCKKDSVLQIITTVTIDANAGPDTVVCPGSSVVLSGLSSVGAVDYKWFQLPGTSVSATTPSFVLANAEDGLIYRYELLTISSTPGCTDRDTIVISTYSIPYIDAGPSYTIPVFATVTIGGNPTTSGAIGSVTWSPAFSLSDINLENPVASNTIGMTYTASLAYGKGCIVSDTMQVLLYPEVKINNGFSPNNDGKNDYWYIDYLEQFPDNTVEIYNRWGEQLFYSKGYKTPFDGKYKGHNLPVGTYYYVIHLNHPAYPKPYTGPLTIFR
jgi:gliding motility-associated-like protein